MSDPNDDDDPNQYLVAIGICHTDVDARALLHQVLLELDKKETACVSCK